MLTLSSISQRIEQLEEEEYSSTNAHLETWRSMVAWQFWLASLPDKDNWRKAFNELPLSHPVRELAGRLTWLEVQLSPVLTARRDGFWGERVHIALDLLFTDMLDSGYSQDEISTQSAMEEGMTIVNTLLDNTEIWHEFYEDKKQQQEFWRLQQEYRRQANFGQLTPQAEEWLKTFDAAFWQNFTAKKETKPVEVKPITTQAIPQAIPEVKPEVPKPTNEYVSAFWTGLDEGWLVDSLDGTLPVHRGREYHLSSETWQHIESDSYLRQRWHKVSHE